jgi:uncharacterized protein YyaL (SSP411 family)
MQFQAENLRIYAEAYALWQDPKYLDAAKKIRGFLRNFLTSPESAFYTSQNADVKNGEESTAYYQLDDAGRRKRGLPHVDQHIYARENGWAINALATFYAVSGDETALKDATRAADWIIAHRSLGNGGFGHDEHDSAGPYLGDSVSMARAFLKLYEVTGDPQWLQHAGETAQFAAKNFNGEAGYQSVGRSSGTQLPPKPQCGRSRAR